MKKLERKTIFFLLIGFQVFILLFLIYSKLIVLHKGHPVELRVIPVDPTSLFRGKYVTLTYPFSTIVSDYNYQEHQLIYVKLVPSLHNPKEYIFSSSAPTKKELGKINYPQSVYLEGKVISDYQRTFKYLAISEPTPLFPQKTLPENNRDELLEIPKYKDAWKLSQKIILAFIKDKGIGWKLYPDYCLLENTKNKNKTINQLSQKFGENILFYQALITKEITKYQINIEYGIEAFFTQENKARPLEHAIRDYLVFVHARVKNGDAVIKDIILKEKK